MIWASMFDPACRQRMLERLHRLQPDAARRFGRMTAPQMVVHLGDQLRHALGDAPVRVRGGLLSWRPVRFAAIYLLPWPKGRIKGPSEAFVTRPTVWEADVAGLEVLMARFAERDPQGEWPPHALFGQVSGVDWGVLSHKHFNHHLGQFGV